MNPADTTQARRFLRALATTRPQDGSIAADAMTALQTLDLVAMDCLLNHRDAVEAGREGTADNHLLLHCAYRQSADMLAESLGLACSIHLKPLSDSSTIRTSSASQPATDN